MPAGASRQTNGAYGAVGPDAGQTDPGGGGEGKRLSPARRRRCVDWVRQGFRVSERRACRVLGQQRSTQRHVLRSWEGEARLVEDIVELARQYGLYGYPQIAALLRDVGWQVNTNRVERLLLAGRALVIGRW